MFNSERIHSFKVWYSILIFSLLVIFDYLFIYQVGLDVFIHLKWLLLFVNFLVFSFLVFFNSYLLLCLALFILPYAKKILNFEIWVITFNPYTISIVLLSFYSLFLVLFGRIRYEFDLIDFIILLICISFFTSTILSENVIDAGFLAFHAIFIPVLSYFAIKALTENDFDYKLLIYFFLFSLSVYAAFALINFLKTHERVFVFSVPPIGVATYLSVAIFYLLYNKWYKNFWGFLSFLLNVSGFLVTFSRVYTLTVLFSPVFYKIFRKGKAMLLISFFFISTLFLTIAISYSPNFLTKVDEDQCFKVRSQERTFMRLLNIDFYKCALYSRAMLYKIGLENFSDHPFFGVGLYRGPTRGLAVITQHNFHIEWLEFGGFFGYILYIALFTCFFKKYGAFVSDNIIAINLLIVFVILCNSLTNGFMHGKIPYVAFIVMGFTAARHKILKLERKI